MNETSFVGWDIGGAHLKVAGVDDSGNLTMIQQFATPLWQGLASLKQAMPSIMERLPDNIKHSVTMTAELTDIFSNRQEGIDQLVNLSEKFLGDNILFYSLKNSFLNSQHVCQSSESLASANWHASASFVKAKMKSGVFIDIGSTTTDIIPFAQGELLNRGTNDQSRMRFDELVYTGVIRTPLMSLVQRVNFDGHWQGTSAEYFANCADIYRILGHLKEHDDLMETADSQAKNKECSIRRLARMIGEDVDISIAEKRWFKLAEFYAEKQLELVLNSVMRIFENLTDKNPTIVGAGVGGFLIKIIAERLSCNYIEFSELANSSEELTHLCNVCAPAVALAHLNRIGVNS